VNLLQIFKETQYKSWFKLFRPRERAIKQFKCPRPQCVNKLLFLSCPVYENSST